jgi:hypothetical protein
MTTGTKLGWIFFPPTTETETDNQVTTTTNTTEQ